MNLNLSLAIGELERSMDQHAHNAPMHDLMGDEAQAHLCRKVTEQCKKAIFILHRVQKSINECASEKH